MRHDNNGHLVLDGCRIWVKSWENILLTGVGLVGEGVKQHLNGSRSDHIFAKCWVKRVFFPINYNF